MNATDDGAARDAAFTTSLAGPDDVIAIRGSTACRVPRPGCGWRVGVLAGLLALAACGPAPQPSEAVPAGGEWREFQGTWTAAGNRHTVRLGGERRASIADFNGSLLLAGPSRPGVGFRAEAIVFNDSATGVVGRAVWTDERGDQIYSELAAAGGATGDKVAGTFVGGTGRYAGAMGSYEFSWRFMLENEDGNVQGQSVGLKGRVRAGSPQPSSGAGGSKP